MAADNPDQLGWISQHLSWASLGALLGAAVGYGQLLMRVRSHGRRIDKLESSNDELREAVPRIEGQLKLIVHLLKERD